jgi:hypothetical protein
MDYELHWEEVDAYDDVCIAQLEAEIAHDKEVLASLSHEDLLF